MSTNPSKEAFHQRQQAILLQQSREIFADPEMGQLAWMFFVLPRLLASRPSDAPESILELNLSSESDEKSFQVGSILASRSGHSGALGGHMAKITNSEALEARRVIIQHIDMTIATLKALDLSLRRDHRSSSENLAEEASRQAEELPGLVLEFNDMPAKM